MKIVLFGANGMSGSRIANEALMRGHNLTTVVRDISRFSLSHENLNVVVGNVLDPASVADIVEGHDVVISAVGPGSHIANDPHLAQSVIDAAHSLIIGLKCTDVRRLVVVGGAGSLEVAPGVQLVDSADFPEQYRAASLAHRAALNIYKNCELNWTFFSPAAIFEPGERTGKFRLGTNQLIVDDKGESRISGEDLAVALLDEVEQGQFIGSQMTVGY